MKKHSDGRRVSRIAANLLFFAFLFICLHRTIALISTLTPPQDIHTLLRTWGLSPSVYYRTTYPTSITRDVHPKPIHSHNDYWRLVPLYSALSLGAISIEADVWAHQGELYVGHDPSALSRNRTLDSLYVSPIADILDGMNQRPGILPTSADSPMRGVFDTNPHQTLHLYIDFKTSGLETLPVVVQHLEPLRRRGALTRWNGTDLIPGVVTVHFTGDAPFEEMLKSPQRDYFYDAPLDDIDSGRYNTSNSLMSSTSFEKSVGYVFWGKSITKEMRAKLKTQVDTAHQYGIGVRYWGIPWWPVSVRDEVWGELVKAGVDLLGVDNVKDAANKRW